MMLKVLTFAKFVKCNYFFKVFHFSNKAHKAINEALQQKIMLPNVNQILMSGMQMVYNK